LTIAAILLGVAAVFVVPRPTLVQSRATTFFGIATFVGLWARGPDPALTYVRSIAYGMVVALFIVRLWGVRYDVLSRARIELIMIAAIVATIVRIDFAPDSLQRPLAGIVSVTVVLMVTTLVHVGTLLVRAYRQRTL
jgi:hypothetical protein